ncbi:MAG: hypothetical protein Q8M24_22505 [Pseudolabrys sp.]|nr:hypothetical protein [Pseudolabrys sp.]MDP2298225.1 hypothetical protein [Pseudolabrys sp.]
MNRHFLSATALAAGLIFAFPLSFAAHADEAAKDAIGTTAGGAKIPTTEEARAALMMPDDPNPVPGQVLKPAEHKTDGDKPTTASSGQGDPTTKTGGQAAVGGPLSPGASAGGQNTDTPGGASETTGGRPAGATGGPPAAVADAPAAAPGAPPAGVAGGPPAAVADVRPGPIGATGQTMPSRFSQRNAILDRVPLMAMPFALTKEQRQRIYETVMADKSRQPAAGAEALAPASQLSTEQALNEAQPLPSSLQDMEMLKGLLVLKAKDKVLLVTPATRTVRDQITL